MMCTVFQSVERFFTASTNTNTATSTVTQTFGTDANSDGVLQASELNTFNGQDLTGTDFLLTDSTELKENNGLGTNASGYYDLIIQQDIEQVIYQGARLVDGIENTYVEGGALKRYLDDTEIVVDIVQEIPIFSVANGRTDYAAADAFYGLNEEGNISVDDYVTDLGANRTIVEVLGDGYVTLQKDFVQNFNQDIVQDVYYEIDLIQDFVQEVGINQTYTVDVLKTETRTRLVGE